ncbi:MAG: head GIN domain-containing protein [Mariniphaga sp.]|nr:DUF2807 domain-containing protein [Mariniphaga sp.]MDD4225271.1 DUF2807 domain-containing protein [Mariniphaga sp.]MDD4424845.1 DUF2807 domain-containing protein [Mariniphaga sp.]
MQTGLNTFKKFGLGFIVSLFLVIINPLNGLSQDEGWSSKTYKTGQFKGLLLEGAFGVQLLQGDEPGLEIRVSDPKAFEYLTITNERGLLHLHVDRKPFDLSKITLFVTIDELEYLQIFGSIQLETRGYLEFDDLDLLLEGGAKTDISLKANKINLENKGGVLCKLSGVTENFDVRLAGAGHIQAEELKAREVNFRIEGIGTAKVHATNSLHVVIRGAGKIKYKGNPQVTKDIEGLGSVVQEQPAQ